jgi:hypothetical protein
MLSGGAGEMRVPTPAIPTEHGVRVLEPTSMGSESLNRPSMGSAIMGSESLIRDHGVRVLDRPIMRAVPLAATS